jgi:hypothetical protein
MGTDNPDLGSKALSKVVEIGISSQLDEVEQIDVDIRSDPGKMLQGKVDSVAISGRGLVVKQDLRMERIEIATDRVAIDPLSAVFGNIELTHPTDVDAQMLLTEADLNGALSSDYVRSKLLGLPMELEGKPVTIDIRQATLNLPGENKLAISADFSMRGDGEIKKMSATAIPYVEDGGNQISLEILAAEGQGLTLKLVMAIFEQLVELLDLRNFNLPGMSFQLHRLEPCQGRLIIHAKSQIEKLPSM